MRTGRGHDAVNAGQGVDLVVADEGHDFIVLGADGLDEAFGGVGNDFVYGSKTTEQTLGGEGDDWIEVGAWTGAVGDNFDDQFQLDAVKGHDVFHGDGGFDEFIGEGGDDIWFGSLGRGKFDGMSGFDWTTYDGHEILASTSISTPRSCLVPGASGRCRARQLHSGRGRFGFDDTTTSSAVRDVTAADMPTEGFRGSALDAEGLALITGLQALLAGAGPAPSTPRAGSSAATSCSAATAATSSKAAAATTSSTATLAAGPHRRHVDLRRERPDGQHRACRTTTA